MKTINQAIRLFILMSILIGIAYPVLITILAQTAFPYKANGSIIIKNGGAVGSTLLGQKFVGDKYFWPRPSAINYNPLPSGGSNLGPTSADLQNQVAERRLHLEKKNPGSVHVPIDLFFSSGSGLDPHISPEAAKYQVERIARARGIDSENVNMINILIERHIEPRDIGFLGEPRVNTLRLNIALDSLFAGNKP